jgi:2-enoate reductase
VKDQADEGMAMANDAYRYVIIGGGLAGTEAACDIALKADEVTIVEMLPDILAAAADCLNNDQHLRSMVADRGVKVAAGAKVVKITPSSITYEKDGNIVTIDCDTVLNAAGFRANGNKLEDTLEANYGDVTVAGDAIAPRKILNAVHEGYHAIRVME